MEIELQEYRDQIVDWAVHFVPRLLLFVLVLIIGFAIIRRLKKSINAGINRSVNDIEVRTFLQSLVDIVLNVSLILAAVSIIGVELSALIGILAAIGFAIGLALQGFLGNFASGLTIIFFKPYKVGDWVEISDSFGQVKGIHIFNTILTTPGKKTLIIPNGQVTDNIITNYSTEGLVKLEIDVPVGYEQSFPKIKGIIETALQDLTIIRHEPPTSIGIESYDSHNVIVTVRPYIHPDDFWDATFAVNQAIKRELSRHGVPMTYSEGIELGPIGD